MRRRSDRALLATPVLPLASRNNRQFPLSAVLWRQIGGWAVALLVGLFGIGPAARASDATSDAKPAKQKADGAQAKKASAAASKDSATNAKSSGKTTATKDSTTKSDDKPASQRVAKGPMRIEVTLDGVFEARNTSEISVHPQEWAVLTVLKTVEHGAVVKRGDVIVVLDTDKIDRAIEDLRSDIQVNSLTIKQSEEQLAALEKVVPLDKKANDRAERISQENWKHYLDVEKPLTVKLADEQLKSAKEMVEYQQEEYRQLEKMYKGDDLKEETEKIVLRRAKNAVDRANFNLELAVASHDEAQKLVIPRQDEQYDDQTKRISIDYDLSKVSLPLAMSKRRLDLEKLKVTQAQSEERLTKLLADRASMIIKSPCDGVVYYGRATRGKWVTAANVGETLRKGSPIMPHDTFMTVVQMRPIGIRTSVPESQVKHVRPGMQVAVEPTGFVGTKLSAIVDRVAAVPFGTAGFDAQLTLSNNGVSDAIVPGMNCELKLVPFNKSNVLTIPPKAIFPDDSDMTKQIVYRLGKDDKPEKRRVTVGDRNEKQVEILDGLADGDKVLLDKPKDE